MKLQARIGVKKKLSWGDVSYELTDNGTTAIFSATVTNQAASGYASDLVTFCLYADGDEGQDTRHYEVLSLPGGESKEVRMTFRGLLPSTHYTLLLRCPWAVQRQLSFTTPTSLGVAEAPVSEERNLQDIPFDLTGRVVSPGRSRLLLRRGSKMIIRR